MATLAIADQRFANFSYQEAIPLANDAQTRADALHLIPAAIISGKVIFPNSRPAAGIRVRAQSNDGWGEAITASDGSYVVRQLRPGTYTVEVELDKSLQKSWTANANDGVAISLGAIDTFRFAMIPLHVHSTASRGEVIYDQKGVLCSEGNPFNSIRSA